MAVMSGLNERLYMSAQIIQTMAFTQIIVILTSRRSVEDHLKNVRKMSDHYLKVNTSDIVLEYILHVSSLIEDSFPVYVVCIGQQMKGVTTVN